MKSNQLDSLHVVISERLNAANAINEAMITAACEDPEAPADMGLLDAMAIVLGATRRKVDLLERVLLDTKKQAPRKRRAATLNESNAASGGEQPHTIQ